MQYHNHIFVLVLAAAVAMLAAPASGQIIYGQPVSGSSRLIYSHWSIDDDSGSTDISQFLVPVNGFVPLHDNFEMRFFAANAASTVKLGDAEYKLTGLSDVRLQMNSSFAEDRLMLSVGLNLPTGKKKLSHDEEQPVMAVLTQNYLSFPLRRLGEGFGLNLLAGAAAASGNSRLGGSVMYQVNGSYDAYEGDGSYKPGNMFSVSVNADTRLNAFTFVGDLIFTSFGTDKLEDRKVFKQSAQVEIHAGGIYAAETYGLEGDLRYLIRGRNDRYDENETIDYRLKVFGNEFSCAAKFLYHPHKTWVIAPLVEVRFIAGNEFEDDRALGNADNIGVGFEYSRDIVTDVGIGIGLKYYTGSANGGEIDLSGYRLSAGITAAF